MPISISPCRLASLNIQANIMTEDFIQTHHQLILQSVLET